MGFLEKRWIKNYKQDITQDNPERVKQQHNRLTEEISHVKRIGQNRKLENKLATLKREEIRQKVMEQHPVYYGTKKYANKAGSDIKKGAGAVIKSFSGKQQSGYFKERPKLY